MAPDAGTVDAAVRRLVDDYRDRCLWFLRVDYYPVDVEETLRVLDYMERYGDRAAFVRAREIREWLSRSSSGSFAGS